MRKLHFYLSAFVFSLFVLLVLNGCKKNMLDSSTSTNPSSNLNGLSISEAKAWYEQNPAVLFRSTSESKFPFKISFPFWNKAISTSDSNYYLVDIPVQFEASIGVTISKAPNKPDPGKANDLVRMLILKSKKFGTIQSALMHVVSDDGIVDSTNTYSKRNSRFTGFIFFTNLDGSFINGWKYEDGKITMSSSKKTKQSKISKRINMSDALSLTDPIDPEPVDCSSYTVVYEERYCIGDSGDNCTPWMYVGEDTYTYCTGGGGTSGGGDGGIQYTEYDEPSQEQAANQQWINKIKDSTNDPCDSKVISVLKSLATNTLPDLFRNVFDTLGDVNITFKSADLGSKEGGHTDQNYTTNNYAITINSYWQNASTLSKAATILHEMVHAQLMNWYRQAVNENDYSKKQYLVSNYYLFFDSADIANYPDQAFIKLMNDNQLGQHQIMTFGNFRDALSNTLLQFANSIDPNTTVTKLYTDDLAWTGTYDAKGFTTLPLSEQERLRGIIEGERGNTTEYYNQKGKPCDTQISVE